MRLKDHRGLVDTEDLSKRIANLAESDAGAHGIEDEGNEVVAPAGRPFDGLEGPPGRRRIARLPQAAQAFREGARHRRIDLEEIARRRLDRKSTRLNSSHL